MQPCLDWYDAHGWQITNYAYAFNNYDDHTNARLFDRFDRFRAGIGQVDRTVFENHLPAMGKLSDLPQQRMMPGSSIDTIVRGVPKAPIPLEVWKQIFTHLTKNEMYMTLGGHNIDKAANQGHFTEPDYLEQVVKLAQEMDVACVGMDDLPAVVR